MTWVRGCTGKKRWPTVSAAEAALGSIWSRCRPGKRLPSRYYPCDHCAGFHLTSKPLPSREDTAA